MSWALDTPLPPARRGPPLHPLLSVASLGWTAWLLAAGLLLLAAVAPPQAPLVQWLFGVLGWVGTALAHRRDRTALALYARVFAVGTLACGVSAWYAHVARDILQLDSDASSFFELASGQAAGMGLSELAVLTEGAGAVVLWRSVYLAAQALGLQIGPHIGIAFNTLLVAWAATVALATARRVFGADSRREQRLAWLVGGCGLVWMFSSMHLRDSVVLLTVSLAIHAWASHARQFNAPGLPWLVAKLALASVALAALRAEFVFVPMLLAGIGVGSRMLSTELTAEARRRAALLLLALAAVAAVGWFYAGDALEAAERGADTYRSQVQDQARADSLGARLVVHQPAPVRAVVGSAYLVLFPIPVWSGLQLDHAMPLWRSATALYFYAVLPLLLMGMAAAWRQRRRLGALPLFMAATTGLFIVAIAMTSLEPRHLGAFLLPLWMTALVPDPAQPAVRRRHARGASALAAGMLLLHLVWLALKA